MSDPMTLTVRTPAPAEPTTTIHLDIACDPDNIPALFYALHRALVDEGLLDRLAAEAGVSVALTGMRADLPG
jgi:hypothetical protein